jgi:hypothetical protein
VGLGLQPDTPNEAVLSGWKPQSEQYEDPPKRLNEISQSHYKLQPLIYIFPNLFNSTGSIRALVNGARLIGTLCFFFLIAL